MSVAIADHSSINREHFGRDQLKRKGSDLDDSYLAVLAAYADLTVVGKRMPQSVR